MTSPDISLEEAARQLGVHYMTAYRYVRMGKLPATKTGSQWRVPVTALAEFADAAAPSPRGRGISARDYAGQLQRCLLAGDEPTAWQIISDAMSSAHSLETLYDEVLAEAMRQIGDRWERGELDVAQEHLATAGMTRMIGRLSPMSRRRGPARGTVVLGCVPGDTHALATSLAADPIRHHGFAVFDLGGDTPTSSLLHICSHHDVLALGLFAATTRAGNSLPDLVTELRARLALPILVGGAGIAASSDVESYGATKLVTSTLDGLEWLDAAASAKGHPHRQNRSSITSP